MNPLQRNPPTRLSPLSKVVASLLRIRGKIGSCLGITRSYRCGKYPLVLPSDHLLPIHQLLHRNYDRFLPCLATSVEPGALIIDVGANCGDSLAAMLSENPSAGYVCIEPHPHFFRLLEHNVATMRKHDPNVEIHLSQSLIGAKLSNVRLIGSDGTSHAISTAGRASDSGDAITSRTLDYVMSSLRLDSRTVAVIKSDVDGFDFDVIDSASQTIASHSPALFFECQCDTAENKSGFLQTIGRLGENGYRNWVAFDNFGGIVLRTTGTDEIAQLIEYVWQQGIQHTTRTMYYLDLLAFTDRDITNMNKVLMHFLNR